MSLPFSDADREAESSQLVAVVFRGSEALCHEFSLVLEARGLEHEVRRSDPAWVLVVPLPLIHRAYEEISRYSAERNTPRRTLASEPFPGAAIGACGYAFILLLTAYCAGINLFGADWLSRGAIETGAASEWWRAFTALTLHLDQQHLLGNLLFGMVAGAAVGRLLGPGIAWASILMAAGFANYTEIFIAPFDHRAVGASTAVFAALGLLVGLAWRQQLTLRERRWHVAAPLIAGICLLSLLGTGAEHVDVLGHALGFFFGVGVGWIYARAQVPGNRSKRLQVFTGAGATLLIGVAWLLALH